MNRLILIGNGFDLAHGLPTSYKCFIEWYCNGLVQTMPYNDHSYRDNLCSFELPYRYSNEFSGLKHCIDYHCHRGMSGVDIIKNIRTIPYIRPDISTFLCEILQNIENKGWVDIENEYYKLLTDIVLSNSSSDSLDLLNNQLLFLQQKLVEYLSQINENNTTKNKIIESQLYSPIVFRDISVGGTELFTQDIRANSARLDNDLEYKFHNYYNLSIFNSKDLDCFRVNPEEMINDDRIPNILKLPDSIMFLSFNYTNTVELYKKEGDIFSVNYIHGKLDNQDSIIFGYGDESDETFNKLQKSGNNKGLNNIKSIRYSESDNYRNVLKFMESAPFQVFIMGHSCGSSDCTLLKTIFEHCNCISIKPFYYENDDGTNNYLEIVQNISRIFTDMRLMRDRVVNKLYCEPLGKSV